MKKWLKWLLISIGVILIGIIVFFIVKQSLREEAELIFPNTVIVQNATDYIELDKLIKAIIYNVLEYDTMDIGIAYMPKQIEKIGDLDIKAFIQKNIFEEHAYLILVSSKLRVSEYKLVMSHEMCHLDQFEKGDLVQIELGLEKILYKGDTIYYKDVPYDDRPHEKDAFNKQDFIYRQLEKVLYK